MKCHYLTVFLYSPALALSIPKETKYPQKGQNMCMNF